MVSELIVRNNRDNIDVALLRGGRLVELHKITPENSFSIGDIYLGQIKKTSPALNFRSKTPYFSNNLFKVSTLTLLL